MRIQVVLKWPAEFGGEKLVLAARANQRCALFVGIGLYFVHSYTKKEHYSQPYQEVRISEQTLTIPHTVNVKAQRHWSTERHVTATSVIRVIQLKIIPVYQIPLVSIIIWWLDFSKSTLNSL